MQRIDRVRQEAADYVQFRLGLLTTVLWFALSFGVVGALSMLGTLRAPTLLMIGGLCFAVAALPWLGYSRLVERRLAQLRSQPRA